jgi:hypothetical protein
MRFYTLDVAWKRFRIGSAVLDYWWEPLLLNFLVAIQSEDTTTEGLRTLDSE